MMMFVSKKVAI